MPSLTTMDLVALVSTILCLVLGSVALLFNARRKRPRPVMMIVGLLMCSAGALLGEIAHMTRAAHGAGLAVNSLGLLLTSGGGVCVFVSITRPARVRGGPRHDTLA